MSSQINEHMTGKGMENTEGKIRSVPFYYLFMFIHLGNTWETSTMYQPLF